MTDLNIFSKEIISNNTRCWKQILNFIWHTGKYLWSDADDEIAPVCIVFLNFEIYFLEFPCEIVFGVFFFQAIVYILSF